MPLLKRRRELALKHEATKGTFNAPAVDGTESKFIIVDPTFTTEFGVYERDIVRSDFTRLAHRIVSKKVSLKFGFEVRRQNVTDTPDQWGKILQICGFKETINAATSVVYGPTSDLAVMKAGSIYYWMDGLRVAMKGCMGAISFRGEVGGIGMWDVDISGAFQAVADDPLNTVSHEAAIPPAFQGINFSYAASTARCINSIGINFNNAVSERRCANDATAISYFLITGRNPELTIDPELELAATYDFYTALEAGTEVAASFSLGSTLAFAMPKVQKKNIAEQERSGITVAGITAGINTGGAAGGDDEFTLTCT